MQQKPLKVVCYVPTFNAGETTRAIEVARALVAKANAHGRATDITFVGPPLNEPHFEAQILNAGFKLGHTAVPLDQQAVDDFMTADRTGDEFVKDYDRAKLFIEKYMEDMRERKPDLLINGFIPPAGIAARLVGVPTVTYLPFPAHKAWLQRHLLKDVPDEMENEFTIRLPIFLRRGLVKLASKFATRQPFFTQPTLARAGRDLGWTETDPNIFTMLRGDLEVVTDLPDFYQGQDIGPRARLTGPLFSLPAAVAVDPRIFEIFAAKNPNKVLVTMGSSGEKRFLLEAIAAVSSGAFNAVVVVQPTICSIAEVRSHIKVPDSVYLTSAFVPAHQIHPLADAVIIHGGQGTVQTAVSSGTPFVGVAMQAEQQTNLDNIATRGAGIRIGRKFWKVPAIRLALDNVLKTPTYKTNALALAQSFASINGGEEVGRAIWELVESRGL